MPIYEFKCPNCSKVFEKVCRFREVLGDECPDCGSYSKKIMSIVNFKVDKFAYKPLKKSRPKSYVPTLHDLKLDDESKKKRAKEMR